MRQVAMFVVGFVVVAMAGVAVAQTSLFAGDTTTVDDTFASSAEEVPEVSVAKAAPEPTTKTPNTPERAKTALATVAPEKSGDAPAKTVDLELEITTADGTRVESGEITVTGTVTPGAYVWSGPHEATVNTAGEWTLTVPLTQGKNVVYVGAKLDGVSKQKSITTHWGEPLVWSIHQKVGASKTPVEKFYGTGSPGMTITAESDHGTASAVIDKAGEWWLEVGFTSTPGTTFPVTVTTSTGWAKTYFFSHLGEKKEVTAKSWTINHKYAVNHEPWTKFYGTGTPGTKVVAASAHGSAETIVGDTGEWHLKLWFDVTPGATFEIHVSSSAGYEGTFGFEYRAATFEVTQLYGTCAEDPPYDVFSGRTAPHTWVKAWSEYGVAKVESNADGAFEVKVYFEGAPHDVPFAVDVIDALGNKKTFSFVRTSAES